MGLYDAIAAKWPGRTITTEPYTESNGLISCRYHVSGIGYLPKCKRSDGAAEEAQIIAYIAGLNAEDEDALSKNPDDVPDL